MGKLPWDTLQERLPQENGWEDCDLCSKDRGIVETEVCFYVE